WPQRRAPCDARHGPHPAGGPAVPRHDRRGEPADGRVPSELLAQAANRLGARLRPHPWDSRASRPARPDALRRRAPAGWARARVDARGLDSADRRAIARPCTRRDRARVRGDPRDPRARHDDSPRRGDLYAHRRRRRHRARRRDGIDRPDRLSRRALQGSDGRRDLPRNAVGGTGATHRCHRDPCGDRGARIDLRPGRNRNDADLRHAADPRHVAGLDGDDRELRWVGSHGRCRMEPRLGHRNRVPDHVRAGDRHRTGLGSAADGASRVRLRDGDVHHDLCCRDRLREPRAADLWTLPEERVAGGERGHRHLPGSRPLVPEPHDGARLDRAHGRARAVPDANTVGACDPRRGAGPGCRSSHGRSGDEAVSAHHGSCVGARRDRWCLSGGQVLRVPGSGRPAPARGADRRDLWRAGEPAGDAVCGIRDRSHPGHCRGGRRDNLVPADPLRDHPAGADRPASWAEGPTRGGAAVSATTTAETAVPLASTRIGRGRTMSVAEKAGVVALVALAALIPLVWSNDYAIGVIVTAMITLVLNTSWNFVLGIAGVWNFGQLAIYALGGYGTGLLMLHTPLPPPLAILGGGALAAAVSVLLAFPTLRLHGIYTSLLTFSFAQVFLFIVVNDPAGLTGGSFGFPTVKGLYSFLSPTAALHAYFWTILAVAVAATLLVAWIRSSRLGIALRTIRDSPAYAAARGISPLKYRV